MNKKEIIKKLEAVIDEIADEEEEKKTKGESLNDDESWSKSYWKIEEIENLYTFLYCSNKYRYYADLGCHLMYRIKR